MSQYNIPAVDTLRENFQNLAEKDRGFAQSLIDQYESRRFLSDKQVYWVLQLSERATKPKPTTDLGGDLVPMVTMFRLAGNKLKRPRVRFITNTGRTFVVYPAGAESKNAGWLYAKATGGDYLGKINPVDGMFVRSRECDDSVVDALATFAKDPVQAATAYGNRTSSCCFCGKELTDKRSIEAGYGPTCAQHYGLSWGDVKEVAA